MTNFIDSSKILMYPSAFRAVNPESYLNTEFNLTNTKRLSSYKELNSYIINKDDYYVNFCINGYFFKIKYSDLTGLNLKPLYAYIILKNENSQEDVRVIDRYNNLRLTVVNPNENTESTFGVLDINNEFRGLAFTNSQQDIVQLEAEAKSSNEFEVHHLQLLDNKGEVVGNKFKLSSLEIRNSSDVNKSIYEYFNTGTLEATQLIANNAEITNNLTVKNGTTTLDVLNVLKNATLEKDLTLKGALNDVKIVCTKVQGKGAQATFKQTFNGLNSTIENSNVSNAAISINESGITLTKNGASNSLSLPFNPSGTESKVLVNTAGSSSWVTLTNAAAKNSVAYRDANGDSFFNELFTKNIYVKMPESSGLSSLNPMPSMFNAALKKINDKYVIEFLNLQKIFAAGISSNDNIDTAESNYFISSLAMSPDGQLKLKASTLVPPTKADVVGGVKVSEVYTNAQENYLNNILNQTSLVRPAFVTGDGYLATELIAATNDKYGVVRTGYQIDNTAQNYPVELDSNGRMFVNVPWDSGTDTTYDSGNGLYLDNITNKLHIKTIFETKAASRQYKLQVDTTSNSPYTEIPVATDTGYGVVKIGFNDQLDDKLYGVKFSPDNHLYVEVPWISTPATTTELGLVKVGGVRTIGDDSIESATSFSDRYYKVERDSSTNKLFVNVPWGDNHVTSVAGHYTPVKNDNCTIIRTASGGSSLSRGVSNVVTGVTVYRDATGHITDVTVNSGKLPSSDNTQANIYATTSSGTSNVAENTANPYISLFEGNNCRNRIQLQGDATTTSGAGLRVYASNGIIHIKGPALTAGTTQGKFNYAGSDVSLYNLQTTSLPTFAGMSLTGALNMKTSSIYIRDSSNNTKATISSTGTITAVSFTSGSDIRIKENIEEFKYTKSILDLPIKKFDYIDGPKNQIGCIAQDLQKLYPELVKEDDEGYLSINESKLVYLLIEEVKQLKKELKQVKNDVLFLN